jgi:hypothetical protein
VEDPRPTPDLDDVREALREHDERVEEDDARRDEDAGDDRQDDDDADSP